MFSSQFFDKPTLELVTKDDLEKFFASERYESDKIEFKSYVDFAGQGTKSQRDKDKTDSIIQSICGFLNSDGGLLIWGAPEGKPSLDEAIKEKVFTGALKGVEIALEKDQFISKVCDLLSPTPLRVLFHKIKITDNSFCYLFEVSKSDFAPHQYKGTYYMRLDGSTRPAPHHYVEALMKKISYPRLTASITFGETRTFRNYFGVPLIVSINNLSKIIQDKNVCYRVISTGAGLNTLPSQSISPILESDIQPASRPVIHYNMPTYDEYYLVSRRIHGSMEGNAKIVLSVWGDLSPMIFCMYELNFFFDSQDSNIKYSITKEENIYSFERAASSGETESERVKVSDKLILDLYQQRIIDNNLTYFLSK